MQPCQYRAERNIEQVGRLTARIEQLIAAIPAAQGVDPDGTSGTCSTIPTHDSATSEPATTPAEPTKTGKPATTSANSRPSGSP
jgi:hypothetical protein